MVDDKKEWTFIDETAPSDPISGNVINDYLEELVLGSDDDGIIATDQDSGAVENIGNVDSIDDDPGWIDRITEALPSELTDELKGMGEQFTDWLYEAKRPNFGEVDIGSYGDDVSISDLRDKSDLADLMDPTGDYSSDIARALIQTGGYMGDFWKDLGMLPYNLMTGKEEPFQRIIENPKWAEEIGYETKYGKKIMDNPAVRMFQEHFLPFAGAGIIGAATKIPKAGNLLKKAYPMTAASVSNKAKRFKNMMKAIYNPGWAMLPKPGNWAFNIGLPSLWNQGIKKQRGDPENIFDRAGELFGAVDMPSPVSSAYAADVSPGGGGYAAGQMPMPTRTVTQRHPREMMEMANRRGLGNVQGDKGLEVTLDLPYT